jgi:heme oxygenase (biliverdin-IX-beta and delta-forming)
MRREFGKNRLEIYRDLPKVETFAQTLGAKYVFEGATLGGRIISRHLRQNLHIMPEKDAAFFNSYGENVGQMWKAFGALTAAHAGLLNSDEEIIASAQETFTKFEKWFSGHN